MNQPSYFLSRGYLIFSKFLFISLFMNFSHQHWLVGQWQDSKSSQFSWTLLNILADLNSAVVWIVDSSTTDLQSLLSFLGFCRTVPSAPTTIGITVTFIFQSSLQMSKNLFAFFHFLLLSAGMVKSISWQGLLLINTQSGILAEIRGSFESQRILWLSFSRTDYGLCIYYLWWSNFNHNSQWITLPSQSCLVIFFLCQFVAFVSSLSPHNLYLLFFCVLSIFALT